jgi:hypothetical protein
MRAQRFGWKAGIFMGAILQHPAPDSYSGQWLLRLLGESPLNRRSIDHNGRVESAHFGPRPADNRVMSGNDEERADRFSFAQN